MKPIESWARFRVQSVLSDNPGADVVMLSIETDLSDDDLRLTLAGLVREGAIRVDEFGHFFLN